MPALNREFDPVECRSGLTWLIRNNPKVNNQIASQPFRISFLVLPFSNTVGFERPFLKKKFYQLWRGESDLIEERSGLVSLIRRLPVVTKQKFNPALAGLVFFFLHANSSEA